jgi:hypothetical protein
MVHIRKWLLIDEMMFVYVLGGEYQEQGQAVRDAVLLFDA